jgi:ABC-2 type transport system permease protein
MHARVPATVTRRRTLRGALALGLVSGAVVGIAAEGYVVAYPDPADRTVVAASIGGNPGLAALFGTPRALETVAGFTEWRVLGVLPLVGAVWALLAGTAALRGEEDAGRWDVLLTGPLTRRAATGWGLAGIGVSVLALAAVTAASSVATGAHSLGVVGTLWTAAALVMAPAVFLAVAAVTSQVGGTRGQALLLGAGLLGAAYLLRVVATAVPDLEWVGWLSPLGWVDRTAPLTQPDALPLAVAAVATPALAGLAAVLAGRRDAGAGLLTERRPPRSRLRLLAGPTGLTTRLSRGTAFGWLAGLAVVGLVLGLVAPTASEALADSQLSGDLGLPAAGEGDGVTAFLGAVFVIVALLLALLAAGQAAGAREEEASGRLETLLALPVGRLRWLGARLGVSAALLLAAGLVTGLAAWLGTVLGDAGQPVGDLLAAGLTSVPAGLVVLGLGVLTLGLVPRWTSLVAYGYVAGAFLLEVLGSLFDLPEAVLGLSVFYHVPLVPAADPEPLTAAGMVAVAVGLTAAGAVGLRRRDVTGP